MYTDRNFKTKKELKAAVEAYNTLIVPPTLETALTGVGPHRSGRPVTYHQPGPFGGMSHLLWKWVVLEITYQQRRS